MIGALSARGYKIDDRRGRVYARAEICHESSGKNAPSIVIQDGPNDWHAYCHSCERKVSREVAMAIGTMAARSVGGRYVAAHHDEAAAAEYLRARLARCGVCNRGGELIQGKGDYWLCADPRKCAANCRANQKARA